jgi:hypothetical protein
MIYTNATEEVVSSILMQGDEQGNEKTVAYMSQIFSGDDFNIILLKNMLSLLLKLLKNFSTSS